MFPNVPLGAIKSIHELASQRSNIDYHFDHRDNEQAASYINRDFPLMTYVRSPR